MENKASLEGGVMRLRPHHVKLILDQLLKADDDESIISSLQDKEYSKRCSENYVSILHKFLMNSRFEVVPALDDICAECIPPQKYTRCHQPDAYSDFLLIKELFGIAVPHRIITPLEMLSEGIKIAQQGTGKLNDADIMYDPDTIRKAYRNEYWEKYDSRRQIEQYNMIIQRIRQNIGKEEK